MKQMKKVLSLLLAIVMFLSSAANLTVKADTCGGLEPEDVYQPSSEEVVQDPILHWAIRAAMNSIKGGIKLTADVVGDKSVKDISYELCAHPEDFENDAWAGRQFWIESLEGLQYATSASMIDIAYTSAVKGKSIDDLTPLENLTQLKQLILKQNGITDISPLKNLSNLSLLDISANQEITDISAVAGMVKLTSLNASFNKITSVDAVSGLTELEYLNISDNNITRLPDCSNLGRVNILDASHNQITDISELAKLKNLQVLNLSGNNIADITPLAKLIKLDKDSTTLPDNSKKDDLFAAIEVNKLFALFNISKMREADLNNVQAALDAFDELTEEQKTYFEPARIEAARSNKSKVEFGAEPDYYPEYDEEGIKIPVFNGIEISVYDKYGSPMADVEFTKLSSNSYSESKSTVKTDSVGKIFLKHTSTDPVYDLIKLYPSGDTYVADPEYITYTVAWGNVTETVNGKTATGLEELKFTLIPKDEYVDKSELEAIIDEAASYSEAYKYTAQSYQKLEDALASAQTVLRNVDAKKDEVNVAISALKDAIEGLEKNDIATELKLIVKDENGNLFSRPFKFQVRVPQTGAEAWNDFSDAHTGIAYLKAAPGWEDGKVWEIVCCYEEPYEIDPITVTIGIKEGQRYFKTVNGKAIDVDFQMEVIAKPIPGGADSIVDGRKPDSKVLEEVLAAIKELDLTDYTPSTIAAVETAIEEAESAVNNKNASQEDYNAAIASLRLAQNNLKLVANKVELRKEINLQYGYSESAYTKATWEVYQTKLAEAEAVNEDGDATQEAVDKALAALKDAGNKLVRKADKSELEKLLAQAKSLNKDDYQSGVEELEVAIAQAEIVIKEEEALQSKVDERVEALEAAIAALVKKPVEVDYACYPGVFRAKVIDENGNPVEGVIFESIINGVVEKEKMESDVNGIFKYDVYGQNRGKTTYIKLADERYTTTDVHYFTADGVNDWIVSMKTIDGVPYAEGTRLTYVVKLANGEEPGDNPEPADKVLCDENTFRAKVVDGNGAVVDGATFVFDNGSEIFDLTSVKGILERSAGKEEAGWNVNVSLKDGQKWTCDTICNYKHDDNAKIAEVNGKSLAEADEVVFILKTVSEEPEEINKNELADQIFFAESKKQSDYTKESFKKLTDALEVAKAVYEDEEATQKQIDDAAEALEEARLALVEAEKIPVCEENYIRIQIVDEQGNPVKDKIKFSGTYPLTSSNGVVEYNISGADSGLSQIVVSYNEEEIVLNGKTYVVTPKSHTFTLEEYAGDVFITKINGETLDGTKEVKFVLKEKGAGLLGDVNADGTIDTSDAQAIFNHFMGINVIEDESILKLADVNNDNVVDTSDAQLVFNIFMGIK